MVRVLVVNDEERTRPIAAKILEAHGFLVDVADDGADAIDRLDYTTYQALVIDVVMPRVDGPGVLLHLSKTNPTMIGRTILVATEIEEATSSRLDEVCRVLVKPIDVARLIAAVYECLPA